MISIFNISFDSSSHKFVWIVDDPTVIVGRHIQETNLRFKNMNDTHKIEKHSP
jgi:hypothetical protein